MTGTLAISPTLHTRIVPGLVVGWQLWNTYSNRIMAFAVIAMLFGGIVLVNLVMLFALRKTADELRNIRGDGRGGGPHPLPVTGAVETSRGSANPKESKPVGPDKE